MKLKSIYIKNLLSFKDTFVRRNDTLTIEPIPLSNSITTVTGPNNSGKTNFLRCIHWLFDIFIDPAISFTYAGDAEYRLIGTFEVEEKDISRLVNCGSSSIKFLNALIQIFTALSTLQKRIKEYSNGNEDLVYAETEVDQNYAKIDLALKSLSEESAHVSVTQDSLSYMTIGILTSEELIFSLKPFKGFIERELRKLITNLEQMNELIIKGTVKSPSKPSLSFKKAIRAFNDLGKVLDDLQLTYRTKRDAQTGIETALFKTKFIDETRNRPISSEIKWTDPIGKDIMSIVGDSNIHQDPQAAEASLNKIVNERIKEFNFPLLHQYQLCFFATKDSVKITLYDPQAKRFYTIREISLGTRWLLSLWFQIYAASDYMPDLLIIDEPGFNMHPGAQKELLSFFEKITAEFKNQLIYTTHSPFMVNPNRILDIRLVNGFEDTSKNERYSVTDLKAYKANYEPLYTALGLRFVKPYLLVEKGTKFLLVEGESDSVIVMSISQLLFHHGENCLDLNEVVFFPTGGACIEKFQSAIDNIKRQSSSSLITVLVDGDARGKEIQRTIEKKYPQSKKKEHLINCVNVAQVLNKNDATIEDFIPVNLYVKSFIEFYSSLISLWGTIDFRNCVDFITKNRMPIIKSIIKYFETNEAMTMDGKDINKTGIARVLADMLLDEYGGYDRKEAFLQAHASGKKLIQELIASMSV